MSRKKCAFGFSCAAMMMQPGLTAEDCPNSETCGILTELTPEEEVELQRVREIASQRRREEWDRIQETIRVTQHQAAVMMLMSRGCSQSLDSLGVLEGLAQAESSVENLRSRLRELENTYIAPPQCEAHRYNVKRPWGTYWYNKLTAKSAIFEPSERVSKVRVIHLSLDEDARNLEGREGITRRNKLLRLTVQLSQVQQILDNVLADL